MISNRVVVAVMTVIVGGFLAIGTLYALKTPEWQSPDEPAHYNYAAQVAEHGCCPVLQPGDWDAAKLEQLKADGFPESADVSQIQYEDHQPPAFYLLASLVFTVSRGSLLAIRLLSLALGAGAIVAVYTALSRLLPYHKPVALAGAAFVAFLPEYIAIAASANNDSLSILAVSILTVSVLTYLGNPAVAGYYRYKSVPRDEQGNPAVAGTYRYKSVPRDERGNPAVAGYDRYESVPRAERGNPALADRKGAVEPLDESSRPHAAALGGITGVAFLTKLTIYLPAVILVAVAVLLRWRMERRSLRWLIAQIGWSAGMSIAFGLPWWVRNASLYGWPDIFGLQRHDAVVVGQPRTADLVSKVGMGEYLRDYLTTVYHSAIGQFGWMGVPMPDKFYLGVGLFLLLSLAGLALLALRRIPLVVEPTQRAGVWVLAGLSLASIAGLVEYNFTFQQFQGRYLFPMLTPFAGLVAAGLHGWAKTAGGWLKNDAVSRWLDWLPLALLAWMPALALWSLFKFIVPNLR